nr:PREDICTED: serine proteinase stubble [Bemisia tabaci]
MRRFSYGKCFLTTDRVLEVMTSAWWIFLCICLLNHDIARATPVWQSTLMGGAGRNIRHLPCVSRRTGETGLCMFAFSCAKANGTHLGTCIDRFYFGSCCKIFPGIEVDLAEPLQNNLLNYEEFGGSSSTTHKTIDPSEKPHFSLAPKPNISTSSPYGSSTVSISTPMGSVSTGYNPTHRPLISSTVYSSSTIHPATKTESTNKFSSPYTSTPRPVSTLAGSTINPLTVSAPHYSTSKFADSVSSTSTPYSKPSTVSSTHEVSSSHFVTTPAPSQSTPKSTSKPVSTPKPVPSGKPTKPPGYGTTPQKLGPTKPGSAKPASTKPGIPPKPSAAPTKAPTTPGKPTKPYSKPSYAPTKPSVATVTYGESSYSQTAKPLSQVTSSPSSVHVSSPSSPISTVSSTTTNYVEVPVSTLTPATHGHGSQSPLLSTLSHFPSHASASTLQRLNLSSTTPPPPPSPASIETLEEETNLISGGGVSTSKPSLVTWTTIDEVPIIPPDRTKPPTIRPPVSVTYESATASPAPSSPSSSPSSLPPTSAPSSPSTESWVQVQLTTHAPDAASSPQSGDVYTTPSGLPKDNVTSALPEVSSQQPVSVSSASSTNPDPSISSSSSSTGPTEPTLAPFETNEIDFSGFNTSNFREICGRRLFPTPRIVGGEKASFGKWPWQISLRQWRTSTYLHKCGAALFNENWAVTAAHCVENVPPSDLLLRLGEHDLSIENEPYGYQERRVQIVASHPQFDPRTFEYDLALLRFYEPVKFQPNIIPICVPEDDTNFVSSTAYVTGWGRLYEDGPLPSVLQEVSVPVINNSVCETMYRSAGFIEHIPEIFICAGWRKGGFDSCEGDSGGPMVIQRPDKRWLLAGVISWGIGCAEPNQPGVYTRISEFRDWINQILQF